MHSETKFKFRRFLLVKWSTLRKKKLQSGVYAEVQSVNTRIDIWSEGDTFMLTFPGPVTNTENNSKFSTF